MAKWVYIRGFSMLPHDTLYYTACANAFLTNVQTTCALSACDVDIAFFPTLAFVTITYDAITPIDVNTVFNN